MTGSCLHILPLTNEDSLYEIILRVVLIRLTGLEGCLAIRELESVISIYTYIYVIYKDKIASQYGRNEIFIDVPCISC